MTMTFFLGHFDYPDAVWIFAIFTPSHWRHIIRIWWALIFTFVSPPCLALVTKIQNELLSFTLLRELQESWITSHRILVSWAAIAFISGAGEIVVHVQERPDKTCLTTATLKWIDEYKDLRALIIVLSVKMRSNSDIQTFGSMCFMNAWIEKSERRRVCSTFSVSNYD